MKKLLFVLLILTFAVSFSYAAECKICGNLKSDAVQNLWGARLCNGIANTAFGWTEIFFRPGKVVAAGGNPIIGFFRGLGNAITRTGAGAVELVTFWTPGESVQVINDCPLCAYK